MSHEWKDPLNLIITGVGGQGNILISKFLGEAMLEEDYWVTIGETYGASQRGGSVASHVRVSKSFQYGPIIPEAQVDIILGLEPVESLRMLCRYGNSKTDVITNIRPIHPMAVAIGEAEYPPLEKIKQSLCELSHEVWYLDASQIAIGLPEPQVRGVWDMPLLYDWLVKGLTLLSSISLQRLKAFTPEIKDGQVWIPWLSRLRLKARKLWQW
jgi:indolepyruvate ferredoxin oxidoreductase beta subunit